MGLFTKKVVTRFPPSPTGYLHIGSLRTALYNYLYARQHKGKLIFRIEDTDQARYVEGAVEMMIKTLKNVGLGYDEGPIHQSHRLEIYKKYALQLVDSGHAYYSFRTPAELEEIKKELSKNNQVLKRVSLSESFTKEEVGMKLAQGVEYVIRLEMPKVGACIYNDLVRGEVSIDYSTMDDFVILKSDGFPTYNFANVIDDHEMGVTHVIRGEEFVSSMPKHLYLYEILKFKKPEFAHLPLILNPDRSKLSKRQGDVAVEDYLAKGYLPQTLINFVALLGWNPGEGSTEEFFTMDELIKKFSLEKIHKAGAVFDIEKLDWMNGKYLREKITIDEFLNLIFDELKTFLEKHKCAAQILEDQAKLKYFAQLIRERIDRLDQVREWFGENQWLDEPVKYEKPLLTWKKSTLDDALLKLNELSGFITTLKDSDFEVTKLEKIIKDWITAKNYGVGEVLWPMRVALSGQKNSPNPFEIAYLVGKAETLRRLQVAII